MCLGKQWFVTPLFAPYRRGVQLDFIRPGKLVENAFIKSFNGRLRDECLNVHQFASLPETHAIIEEWRMDYNHRRPHSSIRRLTSNEFVAQRQAKQIAQDALCSRYGLLVTGPPSVRLNHSIHAGGIQG